MAFTSGQCQKALRVRPVRGFGSAPNRTTSVWTQFITATLICAHLHPSSQLGGPWAALLGRENRQDRSSEPGGAGCRATAVIQQGTAPLKSCPSLTPTTFDRRPGRLLL